MTAIETNKPTVLNPLRLSVQISLNGLSFLITNERNENLLFKERNFQFSTTPDEILLELQTLFSENHLHTYQFAEVTAIYATPVYTLVPAPLFDEAKSSEYLKFNSKMLYNDYVAHDHLEPHDLVIVYVPLMNVNNFLFDTFGSFHYYHTTTVFLKSLLQRPSLPEAQLFINVRPPNFDCIILKENNILLCNTFPFSTAEDFVYYLLFAIEQLDLDPDTLALYLCGSIAKEDDTYRLAYDYIRNITFMEAPHSAPLTKEAKNHDHYILKNSLNL